MDKMPTVFSGLLLMRSLQSIVAGDERSLKKYGNERGWKVSQGAERCILTCILLRVNSSGDIVAVPHPIGIVQATHSCRARREMAGAEVKPIQFARLERRAGRRGKEDVMGGSLPNHRGLEHHFVALEKYRKRGVGGAWCSFYWCCWYYCNGGRKGRWGRGGAAAGKESLGKCSTKSFFRVQCRCVIPQQFERRNSAQESARFSSRAFRPVSGRFRSGSLCRALGRLPLARPAGEKTKTRKRKQKKSREEKRTGLEQHADYLTILTSNR